MHIAALDPRYVRREEVTPEMLEKERDIYKAQALATASRRQSSKKSSTGKWKSSMRKIASTNSTTSGRERGQSAR